MPVLPGETGREKRMREILYLNQTRFLLMLLDRKDRMSMATGLEVRVPFCDHRIVEYVWNVPWSMKAYRGREKGLLRLCARGRSSGRRALAQEERVPVVAAPELRGRGARHAGRDARRHARAHFAAHRRGQGLATSSRARTRPRTWSATGYEA